MKRTVLSVAVLAALIIIAAVLAISPQHALLALWAGGVGLAGVVTVTYKYPVSGTVAPTAQQVLVLSMVTAVLNWGDTDTTATITHNFNTTAAQQANLWPVVIAYATALNGSPSAPAPFINPTFSANAIQLTKSSVTNSGGTFNVIILRPNTLIE